MRLFRLSESQYNTMLLTCNTAPEGGRHIRNKLLLFLVVWSVSCPLSTACWYTKTDVKISTQFVLVCNAYVSKFHVSKPADLNQTLTIAIMSLTPNSELVQIPSSSNVSMYKALHSRSPQGVLYQSRVWL